jgi:CHAT domain-containing protein/tetratricopeptide (TPR) repeat protein
MTYVELAEKLIAAKSESERKSLLHDFREKADVKLGEALRNTYYESWTNEPKRVQRAALALKSLCRINPTDEINALSLWVSGISDLTKGNLDSAIKNLDRSSEVFQTLNREYESAQTQVAKLYPLALVGSYEKAIECGKNAIKVFKKYGDELAIGKVEKNLGNVVARQGYETEAEQYYLSARRRFVKIKNVRELTMSENSLANTYAELNNFHKAEKFYASALSHAQEARMFVTQAEIEASIGNLALFRGRFDQALKFLELSRRKYETLDMPHQSLIAELEIADIYLELNLTKEAREIYERIADRLKEVKMQGEEARARANFGRVAVLQNETETARRELKKSAQLYVLEKNKIGAAAVKLSEATLELELGNYRQTVRLAQQAKSFLKQFEYTRFELTARWLEAEALRNLDVSNAQTRKNLLDIYAESIKQEQANTAQAAQISLGRLAIAQNDYRQAEKHFRQAIKLIETLRAPLAAEEFRMAFLANKLAPYENLAKIYLKENKFRKAFLTIENARSRVLAENLGGNIQEADSGQDKIPLKLQKKLETLREELNWFYSRINRADESEIANLQWEAKKREKQIADVMRQIESTRSAARSDSSDINLHGKNTARSETATFKQLQNQLGKQKALIEFVKFEGYFSAFIVTDRKIRFMTDLAKETEIVALLEGLQFQFDALRYGAKNLVRHLDELKKRADFYLRKLYEKLIAPLEKFLGKRNLVIVPVGTLHYVPFHALTDGDNYLIQMREIVYSPSATVWRVLASKPIQKLKTALLIGFADERIPLVNAEIEILSEIFRNSKNFTGEAASFSAFTRNAPNFDILHFACHGNFRPENPLFSSLQLADGWVTVRDICSQNLKAEIVTLSACETGLNKIFAGDEILGLARGFLSAGASSLVLSLWTVNDEATTFLMKNFYTELKIGKTAAQALQIVQRSFIERGLHPYFWSPFALIGR